MPSFSPPFVTANTLAPTASPAAGSTVVAAALADDIAALFVPQVAPVSSPSNGPSEFAVSLSSTLLTPALVPSPALTSGSTHDPASGITHGPPRPLPPPALDEVLAVSSRSLTLSSSSSLDSGSGSTLAIVVRGPNAEIYASPPCLPPDSARSPALRARASPPRLLCVLPAPPSSRCAAISSPLLLTPPPSALPEVSSAERVPGVLVALGGGACVTLWALPLPRRLLPVHIAATSPRTRAPWRIGVAAEGYSVISVSFSVRAPWSLCSSKADDALVEAAVSPSRLLVVAGLCGRLCIIDPFTPTGTASGTTARAVTEAAAVWDVTDPTVPHAEPDLTLTLSHPGSGKRLDFPIACRPAGLLPPGSGCAGVLGARFGTGLGDVIGPDAGAGAGTVGSAAAVAAAQARLLRLMQLEGESAEHSELFATASAAAAAAAAAASTGCVVEDPLCPLPPSATPTAAWLYHSPPLPGDQMYREPVLVLLAACSRGGLRVYGSCPPAAAADAAATAADATAADAAAVTDPDAGGIGEHLQQKQQRRPLQLPSRRTLHLCPLVVPWAPIPSSVRPSIDVSSDNPSADTAAAAIAASVAAAAAGGWGPWGVCSHASYPAMLPSSDDSPVACAAQSHQPISLAGASVDALTALSSRRPPGLAGAPAAAAAAAAGALPARTALGAGGDVVVCSALGPVPNNVDYCAPRVGGGVRAAAVVDATEASAGALTGAVAGLAAARASLKASASAAAAATTGHPDSNGAEERAVSAAATAAAGAAAAARDSSAPAPDPAAAAPSVEVFVVVRKAPGRLWATFCDDLNSCSGVARERWLGPLPAVVAGLAPVTLLLPRKPAGPEEAIRIEVLVVADVQGRVTIHEL